MELLVVIVIIAALAGLTAPMVIRQRKKADQTEAVNNARQVGMAMFEFETEYGSFPEGTLGETINTNTGSKLAPTSITTANDAFLQLLAAGIATSETMFYCKTGYSTKKPDNVFSTTANALVKGEVGYGYIMNTDKAFSAAGNPGRALIAAPLRYDGGAIVDGKFDKEIYDAKAVILKMDNSVTSVPIDNEYDAIMSTSAGKKVKLLDATTDTVWGADAKPKLMNPIPK